MKKKLITFTIGLTFALVLIEVTLRSVSYLYGNHDQNNFHKEPNEIIIMNVGNSYTYGVGAPEGKSYSNYLENFLNKRNNGKTYKVLNKGIISANTSYILERIESWFEMYSPDYVFFMVGEPNNWNKYGFWKFYNSQKKKLKEPTPPPSSTIEKLASHIKIIKFGQYLYYRNIHTVKNKQQTSSLFKDLEINENNAHIVGYMWLGGLTKNTIAKINELSKEQLLEAERCLQLVFERDLNYYAGVTLSNIYRQSNQFKKAVEILEQTINSLNRFDFLIYNELNELAYFTRNNNELFLKVDSLKLKLNSRIDLTELNYLLEHYNPKNGTIRFNIKDKNEEFFLVEKISKYNPILFDAVFYLNNNIKNFKSPLHANNKNFALNDKELNYLASLYEGTLSINPFLFSHNFLLNYNILANEYPKIKNKFKKFESYYQTKFKSKELEELYNIVKHEKAWVINDLENMISIAKKHHSKIIVQTYPPFHNGTNRPADLILREWWLARPAKNDITYYDLNAQLSNLFDIKNGGEKYYARIFGNLDDHQNELGNIEIAKTMLKYIE